MLVKKGTRCKAMCCNSRYYLAEFDFTPEEEPLVCDGTVYLRGKCLRCWLTEDGVPEFKKHGIRVINEDGVPI